VGLREVRRGAPCCPTGIRVKGSSMKAIDPLGAVIRLSGFVSPGLRARLDLRRQRLEGDFAPRVAEELVGTGHIALDIGARFGTYTSLLARNVGRTGLVHAFEPNPQHSNALRTISHSAGNVRVHLIALSDDVGQAALHIPMVGDRASDGLATLTQPAVAHRTVPIERCRLDDFSFERIDFIKCDVEGHELAVLRGGEATLRRLLPPLLVEIERRHAGAHVRVTLEYLKDLGYTGYAIHREGLHPVASFDLGRDQLAILERGSVSGWMPPEYIRDFLFVPLGVDVARLVAPDSPRTTS
jgi:FkbM family methyltransferase